MKRTIAAVVLAVCAGALLTGNAVAQQKTLKEQLVGNWKVVSIKEVYPDGHADTPWGPNLTGNFSFDPDGKVSVVIIGGDLPNSSGKPQESARQVVAYFGTYTVDEASKAVTYTAERATVPSFDGLARKASVTMNGDELQQKSAPVKGPNGSFVPELVLKRVK